MTGLYLPEPLRRQVHAVTHALVERSIEWGGRHLVAVEPEQIAHDTGLSADDARSIIDKLVKGGWMTEIAPSPTGTPRFELAAYTMGPA